jgi:hypothetical protein
VNERSQHHVAPRAWVGVLMAVDSASLLVAALLHLDIGIPLGFAEIRGEWFPRAAIPEIVTALVLALGVGAMLVAPRRAWWVAVAAHTFAALAVTVGLFTIAIGVGPQTAPDVVYHLTLLVVLAVGLIALLRQQRRPTPPTAGRRRDSGCASSPPTGSRFERDFKEETP